MLLDLWQKEQTSVGITIVFNITSISLLRQKG